MHLDPHYLLNYEGYVNPDYLSFLMPRLEQVPVQIDGLWVCGENACEWAEQGILDDVSLHLANASYEAMMVSGRGRELAEFIRTNEYADQSLHFLVEYYGDDHSRSIDSLIRFINGNPRDLVRNIESVASICIQDLSFSDSDELNSFLLKHLPAVERRRARFSLDFFYNNYLRDRDEMAFLEASASTVYNMVRVAKFHACTGNLEASRCSLEKAMEIAVGDFFEWEMITRNCLYLLGDMELFWSAMKRQIDSCTDSFCFLHTVLDLYSWIGTEEAMSLAGDLMHNAELMADADDLEEIARSWEIYFDDHDRASKCRRIAGVMKKAEKRRRDD